MLKMHEIRELIKLVDQSQITDFEYEFEGLKVNIKKEGEQTIHTPARAPVVADESGHAPVSESKTAIEGQREEQHSYKALAGHKTSVEEKEIDHLHTIKSPMVGTFYRAPSPDADPYVREGGQVTDTTVVCIVEAMKLMNEIEAEVRGEVVEVLAENGQLVEYGQPLFLIKPE